MLAGRKILRSTQDDSQAQGHAFGTCRPFMPSFMSGCQYSALSQHVSNYLFNPLWPANVEPDWPLVREEDQFKGEKEAATALTLDEVQHPLRPGGGAWKTEGIPVSQFPYLLNACEKVSHLSSSCDKLVCCEAASKRYIFNDMFYIVRHVYLYLSLVCNGQPLWLSKRQCRI